MQMSKGWASHRCWTGLLVLMLASTLGCNAGDQGLVQVSGKVVFADGTPLDHGILQLKHRETGVVVKGEVGRDGAFSLSTSAPGDGIAPGSYEAAIVQIILTDILAFEEHQHAKRLDPKYARFDSSGLQFEIPADSDHELRIEVIEARQGAE